MQIENVNVRALHAVLNALVGEKGAGVIHSLYRLVDAAEAVGYKEGSEDGYSDGSENGYEDGFRDGYEMRDEVMFGEEQPDEARPASETPEVIELPDDTMPVDPEVLQAIALLEGGPVTCPVTTLPPYQGDSGDETTQKQLEYHGTRPVRWVEGMPQG